VGPFYRVFGIFKFRNFGRGFLDPSLLAGRFLGGELFLCGKKNNSSKGRAPSSYGPGVGFCFFLAGGGGPAKKKKKKTKKKKKKKTKNGF